MRNQHSGADVSVSFATGDVGWASLHAHLCNDLISSSHAIISGIIPVMILSTSTLLANASMCLAEAGLKAGGACGRAQVWMLR